MLLAGIAVGCETNGTEPTPLKQLYTPRPLSPPPHEPALVSLRKLPAVYAHFSAHQRTGLRSRWLPGQIGVLLIALAAMVAAGFDVRHPRRPQNLDLLLTLAVGWCFFDVMGFAEHMNPTVFNIQDWVFTAIVLLTMTLLVRAVRHSHRPLTSLRPLFRSRPLAVLSVVLFALDVGVALGTPPDDAGYFVNIGAQRLRERVRWPYGDPLLTSTPAAAYGPTLYLVHLPFQLILHPKPVNPIPMARPPIETADVYFEPPLLATKLSTIALHLVGVLALFAIGYRLADARTAWALVALYCGSAFVLGVGDGDEAIGGMTFVSHIGPAAVSLLAFALLSRPMWSGVALVAAIGALFYPVFFVPAWMGYYWSRPSELRPFVIGLALAGALLGGSVLLMSRPAPGRGLVATIVSDTIGHQESPEAYGLSTFGFWGQRGGVRKMLMSPLVDGQSLTRPVVLAFFVFATSTFFLAKRRAPAQLAFIVAAVAMGAQLWKIHATATYVAWYYPFLLIGLLCGGSPRDDCRHD